MAKDLKYNLETDKIVSKFAAAHLSTGMQHPVSVIQVGDRMLTLGMDNKKYGIGAIDMGVRSLEQLPGVAQDVVRQAVISSYNIPAGEPIKKSHMGPGPLAAPVDTTKVPQNDWLSSAAKAVARAVVGHAKTNLVGQEGDHADRAKKNVHDVYGHYAQGDWAKVLNAARRYLKNMGSGTATAQHNVTAPIMAPQGHPVLKALDRIDDAAGSRGSTGPAPHVNGEVHVPVRVVSAFLALHERHKKAYAHAGKTFDSSKAVLGMGHAGATLTSFVRNKDIEKDASMHAYQLHSNGGSSYVHVRGDAKDAVHHDTIDDIVNHMDSLHREPRK